MMGGITGSQAAGLACEKAGEPARTGAEVEDIKAINWQDLVDFCWNIILVILAHDQQFILIRVGLIDFFFAWH